MIIIAGGKKKGNNYIVDEEHQIAKIELQRRNGKESLWTIIDLEDLERVINFPYTWYSRYLKNNKSYYVFATVYLGGKNGQPRNKIVSLHQFIMNTTKYVDHIEHNTLDNRKSKLRIISNKNNLTNRKGKNINNTSGYRNVSWNKEMQKWTVQIQINKKCVVLGTFPKEQLEEAGKFAEEMRQKYYGEFAGVG